MITKEITIAGKQVTLAYCYATEIAFTDLSGEDITDFMQEAFTRINDQRMPPVKKTIYAIIACMMAYYNSIDKDAPIKDTDLMNDTTPEELGKALGTVIAIRTDFYKIPTGEEDKKKPEEQEGDKKNA